MLPDGRQYTTISGTNRAQFGVPSANWSRGRCRRPDRPSPIPFEVAHCSPCPPAVGQSLPQHRRSRLRTAHDRAQCSDRRPSSWRSRLLCWCMRSRTRRPSREHRGKGGHAGAVPNPEPLSAKTSPTSTKFGARSSTKHARFPLFSAGAEHCKTSIPGSNSGASPIFVTDLKELPVVRALDPEWCHWAELNRTGFVGGLFP